MTTTQNWNHQASWVWSAVRPSQHLLRWLWQVLGWVGNCHKSAGCSSLFHSSCSWEVLGRLTNYYQTVELSRLPANNSSSSSQPQLGIIAYSYFTKKIFRFKTKRWIPSNNNNNNNTVILNIILMYDVLYHFPPVLFLIYKVICGWLLFTWKCRFNFKRNNF